MENNYPNISSSLFKDCYIKPISSVKAEDLIKQNPTKVISEFKKHKPEPLPEPTPTLNSEFLELKKMIQELKTLIDKRNL